MTIVLWRMVKVAARDGQVAAALCLLCVFVLSLVYAQHVYNLFACRANRGSRSAGRALSYCVALVLLLAMLVLGKTGAVLRRHRNRILANILKWPVGSAETRTAKIAPSQSLLAYHI